MGVLASQGQSAGSYAPAGLAFGQTYYWRIDEVNAPPGSAVVKGGMWSFTVEPYAYPIKNVTATASSAQPGAGPEKTVDGSGLNSLDQHSIELKDMWLSAGATAGLDPVRVRQGLQARRDVGVELQPDD